MNDKRLINSNGKYEESKSFSEVLKINKSYLIEFAWLNVSRNRKLFKREGEKYSFEPFSLCNCYSCQSFIGLDS